MSVVVFTGPTLAADEVRAMLPGADVRPPAARADVYRAARQRPAAIAIIDGRFDQEEAVAHKEVMWALSEGIHVLGAASMGALRAAELAAFGMEGVGAIFEAYHRGALEDDDEVAVSHGDASTGWRATSVAMVDVRATLDDAVTRGLIDATTGDVVAHAAKAAFYPDRVWPLLLERAATASPRPDAAAITRLLAHVRTAAVSRKHADARLLVAALAQRFQGEVAPVRVRWSFRRTVAWERLRRAVDEEGAAAYFSSGGGTGIAARSTT